MKPEQIFEAISYVDEDLLLASEKTGKRNVIHWRRWGTLAACACLALVLFATPFRMLIFGGGSGSSTSSESGASESYDLAAESDGTMDELIWVTCAGDEYRELTADDMAEYGITEEELCDVPESDIGEQIGTVEDANDESYIGFAIYTSVNHENLYIVETHYGYEYMYK